MDPNENYKEQIYLAKQIIKAIDRDDPVDIGDVDRLAELVLALHDWIRKGGYLPDFRA